MKGKPIAEYYHIMVQRSDYSSDFDQFHSSHPCIFGTINSDSESRGEIRQRGKTKHVSPFVRLVDSILLEADYAILKVLKPQSNAKENGNLICFSYYC